MPEVAGRGPTVAVRVPATSANLGPGFDCLGLALALHDTVELAVADGPRSDVRVAGEGAGRVPCDARHLVLRAACATYERAGLARPALRLGCRNAIPHSRGLGSSASAAVAGIVAARALMVAGGELPADPDAGPLPDEVLLDLAAAFDGHADNVAACLSGGLVIGWHDSGPRAGYRSARLEPHPDLLPTVFVAARSSSTAATRGLLPERVPHADAAFAAGRSALAVHALTAAPDLLLPATEDRLHQPYRRPAYPETAELVDALRAAGVPAVVSGAGPTVLALTTADPVPEGLPTRGFTTHRLPVDARGAVVLDAGAPT